jgi:hypothetical protein
MADVLDLNEKRNEREAPDPHLVRKDDFGRPIYVFGVEYRMDSKDWTFRVWAYDLADAEKRVEAIRSGARVYGQIMAEL